MIEPDASSVISSAGFWSYAHQDDTAERGRILALSESVAEEYALLTGSDFNLFVDRNGIEWGDQWRIRIESALADTTFFLPIITPRYFKREECRRELLTFYSQAESLGVSEYLLPVLYATVPDLAEDSPDKAIAIVARTQYVDWTSLRLSDPESTEYRTAVNLLAARLVTIAEQLATRSATPPTGLIASDEPRTLDLLEEVRLRWPDLVETVEGDREGEAKWRALWSTHLDRIRRLKRSGRRGARAPLVMKLAAECLPLAEMHLDLARKFSALAIELDPLIVSLFRLADEGADEVSDLLHELRSDISDICDRISLSRMEPGRRLSEYAALTREMARVQRLFADSRKFVAEGNLIVLNWFRLAFGDEHPEPPKWAIPFLVSDDLQADGRS
jgi:hypothetical protein